MRIISWNCHGGFINQEKYKRIQTYAADVYVISECDNPHEFNCESGNAFINKGLWTGYKSKGLGIFANDTVTLKNCCWDTYGIEDVLICTINDRYLLIAIWPTRGSSYVGDIYTLLKVYEPKIKAFAGEVFICGDFNSNAIWDDQHGQRTHSALVKLLGEMGLDSFYHLQYNEVQGKETIPTFYFHYDRNKAYHIDYFFGRRELLKNVELGSYEDWVADGTKRVSDHVPLVVDLNIS